MLGPTLPLILVALPALVAVVVVLAGLVSWLRPAPREMKPLPLARVVAARAKTVRVTPAKPPKPRKPPKKHWEDFFDDEKTVVFARQ